MAFVAVVAFVAVDACGMERLYDKRPFKDLFNIGYWRCNGTCINLPKGTIHKLIGRELTWTDDPVELKEG